MPQPQEMALGQEGAQLFPGAISGVQLEDLGRILSGQPPMQAGLRLSGIRELQSFLSPAGPAGSIPAAILGADCRPVRAILFDKSAGRNWSVGWHQDRTIAVRRRVDTEGFGPWTIKRGMIHVEPPFELLADMLTLRLHLDAVPATNAPLWVAPGSHRYGRIPEPEIAGVVRQCGAVPCLAAAGDAWLYATPILHASDAAAEPEHRRVLQADYAVGELPGGLQWLGM